MSEFPPSDSYLVSYSGGKDSLVLMDLAYRQSMATGARVEAFMLELVPDMDYYKFWAHYALQRWGIFTRIRIHWLTSQLIRRGVFRPQADPSYPTNSMNKVYSAIRLDTGIEWIGWGGKMIDSLQRRGMMKNKWPNGINHERKIFAPLKDYNHTDILRYLQRNHILEPKPVNAGMKVSGIDLSPSSMLYLKTEWPRDYERVLAVFPLAEGQASRAIKK